MPLFIASAVEGYLPIPQSFPVRDGVSGPGMHPVSGINVGGLAQLARGGGGPVGDPERVPPAVFGLEQGELGAGVRALAAGKDPHRQRRQDRQRGKGPLQYSRRDTVRHPLPRGGQQVPTPTSPAPGPDRARRTGLVERTSVTR